MLYKDLTLLIGEDKVKEHDKVWVCDYRLNRNILDKAIRHIVPTEVIVVSNNELPKGKRVYYSHYHFRKLKKNGEMSSTIIAPYDNTGYRTYEGVSLNIFLTEKECRDFYKTQCKENLKNLLTEKDDYIKKFELLETQMAEEIKSHC